MGISGTTDDQGRTRFDFSDGQYKFRVDYLGYQFWSEEFTRSDTKVTIENGIARIHVHRSGSPVVGTRVYLFKGSGGYLGRYTDTHDQGTAEFELPDRQYNSNSKEIREEIDEVRCRL